MAIGPQLVQAHVHLVGDVAQVAPAAGGAAVVHLEAGSTMPAGSTWMRLGVLAADVEHGGGARVHHVRAQAVAQDLAADVLLAEGQARAAVAGADDIGLFHVGVEDLLDRRLDRRHAGPASRAAPRSCAPARTSRWRRTESP
jgi:hypothetical protein